VEWTLLLVDVLDVVLLSGMTDGFAQNVPLGAFSSQVLSVVVNHNDIGNGQQVNSQYSKSVEIVGSPSEHQYTYTLATTKTHSVASLLQRFFLIP